MAEVLKPITDLEGANFKPLPEKGDSALEVYKSLTDKRLADMEQLTKVILFVAVIGLVGVVVAVSRWRVLIPSRQGEK